MSKHLFVALVAAAGLAACETGDKDRGRTTSATTTRTSDTTDRPAYQTATARDMQQGWVPGRPPSATTSTNLAQAEAQTGLRADSGFTVRPAAYTGPEARVTTTAAAAAPAPVGGDMFAREALSGDIFEVESSRLALERATDQRVRQFAQMMIDDHSAAHDRLMEATDVQGIEVTGRPNPRQIAILDRLANLQGAQFDLEYTQAQVDAHQAAVRLHEQFLRTGSNPQLQALAEERLPILRDHLDQIRPIAEELYLSTLQRNGLNGPQQPGIQRQPMNDEGMQPPRPAPRDDTGLPPPMRRDTPGTQPQR